MTILRCSAALAMACGIWTCLGLSAARADYVSQSVTLDQSSALKDGVTYGSVLIESFDGIGVGGGGLATGQVRLTYSAIVAANYTGIDKTFGIDELGFNTKLSLSAGQISGPGGWKLTSDKELDGFGKFSWAWSGSAKGGVRPNPVTVLISGLGTDANPASFLVGSLGNKGQAPPQGSVDFAMRVAGFTSQQEIDGHFVGGSSSGEPPPPDGSGEIRPTPEPSSILMCAGAAGCLLLWRSWNSRRTRWSLSVG